MNDRRVYRRSASANDLQVPGRHGATLVNKKRRSPLAAQMVIFGVELGEHLVDQ
jgi:hypothetical protein